MNRLNSILVLLVAFVAVFLEATSNTLRHWLGAQIDLLPALMVYASLSSGLFTVTALAIFGGLCFDSLSANPLGTSILPLFAIGYIIYLRRELILREQLFAQLVLGLIASALVPILALLLMSITRQMPVLGFEFVWQWLVMAVGGAVLTPVCFRLFDGLNHALAYRPAVETSFRLDRQIKRGRK
jgi:rod shape-determining protein MreD